MKRVLVVVVALLLLLPLTGCGIIKKKVTEKITDKIGEGIMEKVLGDDVDVDIEDGKITVTDDDGAEWTSGGDVEWPEEGAASRIPRFDGGRLDTAMNGEENCWLYFEDVEEDDYRQYVEVLKDAGFVLQAGEYTDADSLGYNAGKGGELLVMTSYDRNDGELVIQVIVTEE